MISLAIDTSSPTGTLALGAKGELLHEVEFTSNGRHSQSLFPALVKLGLPRLQIDRVIVGLGPGSFSGIRVGIATAQALALAQGCEVAGIPSPHASALRHRNVTRLGIFADARRGEFYVTVFAQGHLERDTYLLPHDQLTEEVSKMTMAISPDFVPEVPHCEAPRAADLLALPTELTAWQFGPDLQPVYLREPVTPQPARDAEETQST